ncbi:MAG: XRE family transcriptional regulator [Sterolibacterium sp.]
MSTGTEADTGERGFTMSGSFGRDQLRAVGQRLRQLREMRNWSLKDLASKSGVSIAAIQKIEMGTANTSFLTVFLLSEALGEPMDRLVQTSLLEARIAKSVHVAIPRRPAKGFDLTGRLAEARMRGNLVVLQPAENRKFDARPDTSPLFAYVMEGQLKLVFADGDTEILGTGDAMHLSKPEQMTWINSSKKSVQVLCVTDSREHFNLTHRGEFV